MKKLSNILWGLVLILLGLIIGANALGVTNIDIFFDGFWTLFIIVPCFIGLFNQKEKTGNIIGLLIGVGLLLGCQNVIDFNLMWKLILPIILIVIGLSFIFKDLLNKKMSDEIKKLNKKKNTDDSCCATFSEQKIKFDKEQFKGADLTAVFGSIKYDLRNAVINEDVVINASSIFGGINILVPKNVKIKIKSTSIFGEVENKSNTKEDEKSHIIYVNGTTLFGDVEIK